MQLVLRIEANEIEKVPEETVYNRIVWKFTRPNPFGATHLVENYCGGSEAPSYKLYTGAELIAYADVGDPVPVKKIGCGGVWFDLDLLSLNKHYI